MEVPEPSAEEAVQRAEEEPPATHALDPVTPPAENVEMTPADRPREQLWDAPAELRSCSSSSQGFSGSDPDWTAACSVLHGDKAWGPELNQPGEWLCLELDAPGAVRGVVTKGLTYTWDHVVFHGFLSHYRFEYLDEGGEWHPVDNAHRFQGNRNSESEAYAIFSEPVFAKAIRLVTVDRGAFPGGTCVRADLIRHETICLVVTVVDHYEDAAAAGGGFATIECRRLGGDSWTLQMEFGQLVRAFRDDIAKRLDAHPDSVRLTHPDGREVRDRALAEGTSSEEARGVFSKHSGRIDTDSIMMVGFTTIEEAKIMCRDLPECEGFCCEGCVAEGDDSDMPLGIYFKKKWKTPRPSETDWVSYCFEERAGGGVAIAHAFGLLAG